MAIPINLLLFVVAAGVAQAIFLSCLIYFHPRSDRSVNRFLTFYILSFCIPMLIPVVQYYFSWQALIFMHPFLLLTAPLLYLYVRSFKEDITWRKAWPHFVIFLVVGGYDVYMYVALARHYPPTHDVPVEIIAHPLSRIRVTIRILQMFVYFILAGRVLRSYQRSIQQLFSETSRISLAWVRWLINGYLFLIIMMAALYATIVFNPEQFGLIILINTALVTPYIYMASFKGVTQPTIWQLHTKEDKQQVFEEIHEAEATDAATVTTEARSRFALQTEKKEEIVAKIISSMENERIFLQPELTLQDLSEKLSVPAYQVSLAINEGLNKTFYDLVNGYRVEEAKRLLTDPKSKASKILAVAFDAGFNSKTTFNTVFKKFTGLTPSDYKDKCRQQFQLQTE